MEVVSKGAGGRVMEGGGEACGPASGQVALTLLCTLICKNKRNANTPCM